jgi:trigger factor
MTMQATIEELSATRRKLNITVPPVKVSEAFQSAIAEIQKTADVRGFRKGKVPASVVRKFFAEDVRKKALYAVIENGYQDALKTAEFFVVSQPQIEPVGEFGETSEFNFVAVVDINPQVDITGYKELTLKTTMKDVTDEDIEKSLVRLSRDFGKVDKVTAVRPATSDDIVTASYEIQVDGQTIENGDLKNVRLDLGRADLFADFVSGVVGIKPNENKKFEVKYPEDYHLEPLKGKTAQINFTLHTLESVVPAAIDEVFAQKMGAENVEGLKRSLRDNLSQNVERKRIDEFTEQIVDQLLATNSFEVPESLVEKVIDQAIEEANQQAGGKNRIDAKDENVRKEYRESAVSHVRGILALGNVARAEGLSVEDKELTPELMSTARSFGMNVSELLIKGGPQIVEEVRGRVLLNKTVKHLVGMSKIETV